MKYFTKDWCFGDMSDIEMNKNEKDYQLYLNLIFNRLPPTLKFLTKHICLHDGIICKATFSESKKHLKLNGIFGNKQYGYYELVIIYYKTQKVTPKLLDEAFTNRFIQLLYDEIEISAKKSFLHKMIFENSTEFEVDFKDVGLQIFNKSQKDYIPQKCQIIIE